MQLVIDISETAYNALCTITTAAELGSVSENTIMCAVTGIQSGIELPEGHGRLIDADERRMEIDEKDRWVVDNAQTVIEADKR